MGCRFKLKFIYLLDLILLISLKVSRKYKRLHADYILFLKLRIDVLISLTQRFPTFPHGLFSTSTLGIGGWEVGESFIYYHSGLRINFFSKGSVSILSSGLLWFIY